MTIHLYIQLIELRYVIERQTYYTITYITLMLGIRLIPRYENVLDIVPNISIILLLLVCRPTYCIAFKTRYHRYHQFTRHEIKNKTHSVAYAET